MDDNLPTVLRMFRTEEAFAESLMLPISIQVVNVVQRESLAWQLMVYYACCAAVTPLLFEFKPVPFLHENTFWHLAIKVRFCKSDSENRTNCCTTESSGCWSDSERVAERWWLFLSSLSDEASKRKATLTEQAGLLK
jgi:hypothetical protein